MRSFPARARKNREKSGPRETRTGQPMSTLAMLKAKATIKNPAPAPAAAPEERAPPPTPLSTGAAFGERTTSATVASQYEGSVLTEDGGSGVFNNSSV